MRDVPFDLFFKIIGVLLTGLATVGTWLLKDNNTCMRQIRDEMVLHGRDIAVQNEKICNIEEKLEVHERRVNRHSDEIRALQLKHQNRN